MEIERKVPEKKVKILLSSCSLVGRKGFRCSGGEKVKVKKKCLGRGLPRQLGAMLIENSITWANWKDKVKIAVGNKK